MDTSASKPTCFTWFDSTAHECSQCSLRNECLKEQERVLSAHNQESEQQEPETAECEEQLSNEEPQTAPQVLFGNENVPKHKRQFLEIPPAGTCLTTTFKGQAYEAVVVDDPSNRRGNGRSILFNGTIYKSLTAAARAISTGINSGGIWSEK